jgi:hypothetical protein
MIDTTFIGYDSDIMGLPEDEKGIVAKIKYEFLNTDDSVLKQNRFSSSEPKVKTDDEVVIIKRKNYGKRGNKQSPNLF